MWVPAQLPHRIDSTSSRVYILSFMPPGSALPWTAPTVLGVTGFARETIIRLAEADLNPDQRRRTESVLGDAVQPLPNAGLDLPLPRDGRLRRITCALLDDPTDSRTIADWGHDVGASVRTLTRLFSAETGMTFAQWRLQARTRQAIAQLVDGRPVNEVARLVGYRSTSAFSYAFRRTTGQAPTEFTPQAREAS